MLVEILRITKYSAATVGSLSGDDPKPGERCLNMFKSDLLGSVKKGTLARRYLSDLGQNVEPFVCFSKLFGLVWGSSS